MKAINPYLTLLGNCEEAFTYYKSVFGGEFASLSRFSEMPPQEGMTLTEEQGNKIMHVSLAKDVKTFLMGSDSGGEWAAKTIVGNNITLSITAETKEEADMYFSGLSEDGAVVMPMKDTFWESYFGMCTDKFGINWMISFGAEM